MPRFDLHRRRGEPGYLLNLQSHLHDHLSTRVVAPLIPEAEAPLPTRNLNPAFEIDGTRHILFPQYMAAIPRRELGRAIGSLAEEHDTITKALDVLLTGF